MIVSVELENDMIEAITKVRNKHRINGTILVTVNNDLIHVNSQSKNEGKDYMFGYGVGFQEGQNVRHDKLYGNIFSKNTRIKKEYQ